MLGDDLMDFARILDGSCRCLESCGSRIETLTFVRRSFDIAHLRFPIPSIHNEPNFPRLKIFPIDVEYLTRTNSMLIEGSGARRDKCTRAADNVIR